MAKVQRLGKHFVYELIRPDGRVFYVGKGTKLKRMNCHENEAKKGDDTHKCRIIRKIWAEGGEVGKRIVFWSDDEEGAFVKEKELIAFYGKQNLANTTDGGEGSCGVPASDKNKKILSEFHKGNKWRLGIPHSDETKAEMSRTRKGKKRSEEFRQKMKKVMKGKKNALGTAKSPEAIEKYRASSTNRKMTWGGKVAKSLKGKTLSEEHRKAISDGLKRAYKEGKR